MKDDYNVIEQTTRVGVEEGAVYGGIMPRVPVPGYPGLRFLPANKWHTSRAAPINLTLLLSFLLLF